MDDPSYPDLSVNAIDCDQTDQHDPSLGRDTVFEALARERRRYLLYAMVDEDALSLRELAAKVAARESRGSDSGVDEDELERISASLYHAHVPKLVDLEIVEFDRETETITRGENAERVLRVLDATDAIDE